MYHSLARGYATQFINQKADYANVEDWFISGKSYMAISALNEFEKAKKPGRVLNRLSRITRPTFRNLKIEAWKKNNRKLRAVAFSSTQEGAVFSLNDDIRPHYKERSVVSSEMGILSDGHEIWTTLGTRGSINHHALTRLFERGVACDETIEDHVSAILEMTGRICVIMGDTNLLDQGGSKSFLLPYANGALPIVTMEMVPNVCISKGVHKTLAVRTFLTNSMLTDDQKKILGDYKEAMARLSRDSKDTGPMLEWLETNARPFDLSAKASRKGLVS